MCIDYRLVKIGRAAHHALYSSFFLKKCSEERRKALILRHIHETLILCDRQKCEIKDSTVLAFCQKKRLPSFFLNIGEKIIIYLCNAISLFVTQHAERFCSIACCTEGKLAAEQRRKSEQRIQQKTVERLLTIRLCGSGRKSNTGNGKRIVLVLCGRHAVEQAGQHLALSGQVTVHAAHCVDNTIILAA